MAARAEMTDLIRRLRRMIDDPGTPETGAHFADEDVQEALDKYRSAVQYATLTPVPSSVPGGGFVRYLEYRAPLGDWDAAAVLYDSAWNVLTPATADLINGVWTFVPGVSGLGQYPPVYLVGWTYDLNAAAAVLLTEWASAVKLHFDSSQQGVSMHRSQKHVQMFAQAAEFASRRRPRHIRLVDSGSSEYYGGGW